MINSFEFQEMNILFTSKPNHRTEKFDKIPSFVEFILKKPIQVLVRYETKYLVNGKTINRDLTLDEINLFRYLDIDCQKITSPVYIETNVIVGILDKSDYILEGIENYIVTDDRLTGQFNLHVNRYQQVFIKN